MTLLTSTGAELTAARTLSIKTAEEDASCAEDLKRIKALQSTVEDKRKAITANIDGAKKLVQDVFKPAQNWLADAEETIKKAMLALAITKKKAASNWPRC